MGGFELIGNILKVSVDLDLDSEADFKEACNRLLACGSDVFYIDLTKVGFIGSAFFGQMFAVNYQAKKSGRRLVVRVPPRLMAIMEILGLPQLMEVVVVEEADQPKEAMPPQP